MYGDGVLQGTMLKFLSKITPSIYPSHSWTTDRSAHDSTFAKGQVQFIDEVCGVLLR